MQGVVCSDPSVLLIAELCFRVDYSLFICSPTEGVWVVPSFGDIAKKAVGNIMDRPLCDYKISFLCFGVQWLSHVVVASLEFLRSCRTVSQSGCTIHIPASSACDPHVHQHGRLHGFSF